MRGKEARALAAYRHSRGSNLNANTNRSQYYYVRSYLLGDLALGRLLAAMTLNVPVPQIVRAGSRKTAQQGVTPHLATETHGGTSWRRKFA